MIHDSKELLGAVMTTKPQEDVFIEKLAKAIQVGEDSDMPREIKFFQKIKSTDDLTVSRYVHIDKMPSKLRSDIFAWLGSKLRRKTQTELRTCEPFISN